MNDEQSAQNTESLQNAETGPALREKIVAALQTVEDPELFLDIWFLGLIYNIDVQEGAVTIEMTFTSPMCPAGPLLVDRVKNAVGAVPSIKSVEVKIVFNPPWVPSDEVKALLGLL